MVMGRKDIVNLHASTGPIGFRLTMSSWVWDSPGIPCHTLRDGNSEESALLTLLFGVFWPHLALAQPVLGDVPPIGLRARVGFPGVRSLVWHNCADSATAFCWVGLERQA